MQPFSSVINGTFQVSVGGVTLSYLPYSGATQGIRDFAYNIAP